MKEDMLFYDYTVENGVVSAKGTYQEGEQEEIPIHIFLDSNGGYRILSENHLSEDKQEWIIKAFRLTLETQET